MSGTTMGRRGLVLAGLAWALSARAGTAGPEAPPRTPNEFLARGTPTFVVGTAGDDRSDAAIAAQAGMVRDLLFPAARTVRDTDVKQWPTNAVVYGGPHVNALVARFAPALPFRLGPGRLEIGGMKFEGDEHRLIALVPARAATEAAPGHPAFLLYAGTGTPGIAEINGVRHGGQGVLVIDRFGPVVAGAWEDDVKGGVSLRMGTPVARPAWRTAMRAVPPAAAGRPAGEIGVARLADAPVDAAREAEEDAACVRGVTRSIAALGLDAPKGIVLHVHPDAKRKAALTSFAGDGHADIVSRTLHVGSFDPSEGGGLEHLVAHETTHVVAYDAWGAAGTPLLGEGLAVWASGTYGGRTLAEWRSRLPRTVPALADLLGPGFRKTPEAVAYPVAGLLVGALVTAHGFESVRTHFLPATARTWAAACAAAGTSPENVEAVYGAALTPKTR